MSLQVDELNNYGCDKVFTEKKSGRNSDRPELKRALEYLRAGDRLIVYKLDRLARSTFDLHKIANELQENRISLVFFKEQIDFTTASGKLMFTMLGAIAEFERDLINDRTAKGRERAKAQGKHLGRKGHDEKQVKKALSLFAEREEYGLSVNDIVKLTDVPRTTIYAKIKEAK